MLNKELEYTLNKAYDFAHIERHEFMTVEHLLLALLDNSSVIAVLKGCGLNIDILHKNLLAYLQENITIFPKDILIKTRNLH